MTAHLLGAYSFPLFLISMCAFQLWTFFFALITWHTHAHEKSPWANIKPESGLSLVPTVNNGGGEAEPFFLFYVLPLCCHSVETHIFKNSGRLTLAAEQEMNVWALVPK